MLNVEIEIGDKVSSTLGVYAELTQKTSITVLPNDPIHVASPFSLRWINESQIGTSLPFDFK